MKKNNDSKRSKKLAPFFAGVCSTALVCSLVTTALAAGGQVSFGLAGISLFGSDVVAAGETVTAQNGAEVPAVVTYTDEAGGTTNYLSIRQVSELFDAAIEWDSATNTVNIAPVASGDVTAIEGAASVNAPEQPTLGATAGVFTEISPDSVDTTNGIGIWLNEAQIQSDSGLSQTLNCRAGTTVLLTVTNNGETDQYMNVYHRVTVSSGEREAFQTVKIASGATLTRAFAVSEDATSLTGTLCFDVDGGADPGLSDLTVSAVWAY
ncbi:MAG: hypothetical protein LIO54_00550 [Oscillospiraceae bacterium]|nr:hypothetical protein [Oscillospiraceae bacterium]